MVAVLEMTKVRDLALAHWKYTELVISKSLDCAIPKNILRRIKIYIMELCKFLYIEAFVHGYKHRDEELK